MCTHTPSLGPALSSWTRMGTACLQGGIRVRRPGRDRDIGLGSSVYAEHGPMAPFQAPWEWELEWRLSVPAEARWGETGHLRAQGLQFSPLCWTQRFFLECLQLSWKGASPPPHLPSGSHTTGTLLEEGTCSRGNKGISVPSPSATQEWLGQGDLNLFSPGHHQGLLH